MTDPLSAENEQVAGECFCHLGAVEPSDCNGDDPAVRRRAEPNLARDERSVAEAIVATFACREAKGIVSRCLFSGPSERVFRPTSSGGDGIDHVDLLPSCLRSDRALRA
jgi:hypothetical protein